MGKAWQADPFCCLAKSAPGTNNSRVGCAVLLQRDGAMSGKLTNVIRSEERDGPKWSWGNVYAQNRKGEGIVLGVSTGDNLGTRTTESPAMLPSIALAAGDCLRAAAGNAPQAMCAGKSLYEMVQDELFTVYERLAGGTPADDGRDPGRAEALAYVVAMFDNPYAPNIEQVRERCVEWWEDQA